MLPFLISNLSLGLAAWRSAGLIARQDQPALRVLAALAFFLTKITLLLLILGHCGMLQPWPVTIASAILVGAVHFAPGKMRNSMEQPAPSQSGAGESWIWPALFASVAVIPVVRLWNYGTGYFSDDFGYHALAAMHWLREGRLSLMPPGFTSYYPLGSELISFWFCLPFGHDGWAGLAGISWAALACAAFVALGESLGARWAGWLCATAALASTQVTWQLRTFSAVDVAAAASVLAAATLLLSGTHRAEGHPPAPRANRLAAVLLAGATAGLALGIKVSLLPALGLLGICAIARTRSIGAACAFGSALLLVGGAWYAINWRLTGNPFFPAQLGPFTGPMTAAEQKSTTLFNLITANPHPPGFWHALITRYAEWPIGIVVLALFGYATALASCRHRAAKMWMFSVGAVLVLLHPITPFSQGDGLIHGVPSPYPRYLLPSFFIGLALLPWAMTQNDWRRQAGRVLCLAAIASAWPWRGWTGMIALLPAAGLACMLVIRNGRWAKDAIRFAGTCAWVAIPVFAPRLRDRTAAGIAATGKEEGKPIGAAWNALGKLPAHTRVACFSNSLYHRSPLFGPRRDLDPVFLLEDGQPWPHLHEEYRENRGVPWSFSRHEEPADAATLLARLHRARVTHVLISKWPFETWPPAKGLLARPDNTLFDDGYSVLVQPPGNGETRAP